MRVLFVPLPWPTHHFAMVGLAWACRLQGDEVRVAADAGVVEAVLSSGMVGVPVGRGFDFMADFGAASRGPLRWRGPGEAVTDLLRATPVTRYLRLAETVVDDLTDFATRWRPDVVVWDPAMFAGPLAAQRCGALSVRHTWGPDVTRLLRWPGMGAEDPADVPAWPADLAAFFRRHGAEPRDDLADLTLDTCPAALQVPGARNRVPLRYTPYNGPGLAPRWLLDEPTRPRVCVTWGTASTRALGSDAYPVPAILAALATEDVEVVVAAKESDAALVGDPPPNARVAGPLPLHTLLPSCRAIVHQGGSGTVMTAAYHGVPQLVGGTVGDQEFNAARLTAAGAGAALPVGGAEPDGIRAAVHRLLSDDAAHAADGLRAGILGHPSPAATAARLRDLAGH
ncbi:nucleotide disphospho-sugar-binding domain-containing protein [Saccharothrix australiensis]|nr:nucleotide disphospho-sugar-binding domain-containing protein [Saccharothrix australiensis]